MSGAADHPPEPAVPLSRLRGHDRTVEALSRAIVSDRLHPSLIFHGPEGVGRRTAALSVAAALVCERPDGADACGDCHACRRVARARDATVMRAESVRREGSMLYPDVGYVTFIGPARRRILVSQVRDVIHSLEQHPLELPRRVYIVDHAESLSLEAQNALLKTLEEPPGRGVVILIAPALAALLPTTRSRCQAHPFPPLEERRLRDLLAELGHDPDDADARAALAEGRVGRALTLDLDGLRETRDELLSAVEDVRRSPEPAGAAVRHAAALADGSGEPATLLGLLAELARDAVVIQAGSGAGLIHREVRDRLDALAARDLDAASVADELHALRRDAVTFNLNPRMTLEAALLAWTEKVNG